MLRIQLPFAILILIVSVLFFAPDQTATAQNVNIPDANLRAAIESELGKNAGDAITQAEMLRLTGLAANTSRISNLTGLEFAINLRELYLSENQIVNITPLQGLVNLTELGLSYNQIVNITPLQPLVNLTWLTLSHNKIKDVTPLKDLLKLKTLWITHNRIRDFSPIAQLLRLVTNPRIDRQIIKVVIRDEKLRRKIEAALKKSIGDDITQADMAKLRTLNANNAGITNLTGLEFAIYLESLDLSDNQISDISPLQPLVYLTVLKLPFNQIVNISPLQRLVKLTELVLSSNQIKDISALTGLVELTELDLSSNQIKDISALTGLLNLKWLYLSDNQISGISALQPLLKLTVLWLDNNQISNISPLQALVKLTFLVLSGNQISDISALTGLEKLEMLWLDNNRISNISPLQALVKLTELTLGNNQIKDISALQPLLKLETLHLSDNQISDISALQPLLNLTDLVLSGNQISDISALTALEKLEMLWLDENYISDFSPIDAFKDNIDDYQYLPQFVAILDKNLRGKIEAVLGKPITQAKMKMLTTLDASEAGIRDLTGLESATNLITLNLFYNQISDISPLRGLVKLETLSLDSNRISDISALTGLVELTELNLDNNQISDISALRGLKNLIMLYLGNNLISDISALEKLVNLKRLYLINNLISDISALELLVNLEGLSLNQNRISNISALRGLVELTVLRLDSNRISDISALTRLEKLETLWLYHNYISDFSPIEGLGLRNRPTRAPQYVKIPDANLRRKIEDALRKTAGQAITQAEMATITTLEAPDSEITDLTGLEFATNLESLDLSDNQISDITPLKDLVNLKKLSLYDNQISDFSPIDALIGNLEEYRDKKVEIPDATLRRALEKKFGKKAGETITRAEMAKMTLLQAPGNGIRRLTGLEFATNLITLTLDYNLIEDITPLKGLENLISLELGKNHLSDISPLEGLRNLIKLYLYENEIVDITPLKGLVNLKGLALDKNKISDFSPIAGLIPNLEEYSNSEQTIPAPSDETVDIPDATPRPAVDAALDKTNPVEIPDANLRRALEKKFGKKAGETITQAEMAKMTLLQAPGYGIRRLTGLEFATNVITLTLDYNLIEDITPLKGLENLISLELGKNHLSDISPLKGMVNLVMLSLYENQISDISALQPLVNLKRLSLYENQISDISALQPLVNLKRLSLHNNQISDFSPIDGLIDNLDEYHNSEQTLPVPSTVVNQDETVDIPDATPRNGEQTLPAPSTEVNQDETVDIPDATPRNGEQTLPAPSTEVNQDEDETVETPDANLRNSEQTLPAPSTVVNQDETVDIPDATPRNGEQTLPAPSTEVNQDEDETVETPDANLRNSEQTLPAPSTVVNQDEDETVDIPDATPRNGEQTLPAPSTVVNQDETVDIPDATPRNSEQTIPAPSTVGGISLTTADITLAKDEYHVFVRDTNGAGILTGAVTPTVITGMPLLDEFFSNGGTIELVATTGTYGDAHISEIMWGTDDTLAAPQNSQWIEVQANKAVTINRSWRLVFTVGYEERENVTISETEYQVIDRVSNLGLGDWKVPGQSGRTVSTPEHPAKTLISMVRDGSKDGTRSGHWAASARPRINLSGNRIGTPGAPKSQGLTAADKPAIPASPFKITEIGNGSGNKNDWIEVQNVTDTVQNLKHNVFSIVTGDTSAPYTSTPQDKKLFKVSKDVKIPAKAFLLIANTSPEETVLARGQDVSAAAADKVPTGVQSYYYVASGLILPDDGEFLLVLRSEATLDKSEKFIDVVATVQEKFIDVVGTRFIEKIDGDFNTEIWPLQMTAKGHANIIDGNDKNVLRASYVYTRAKDDAFAENALARAGYTGVGYDRDAAKNYANGGTPGYANDAVKENPVASTVSISEIMFDNSRQLPQWIELYNASHTQAVKLNDWTLKIEQSPVDEAVTSRRNVTLKFIGDKIISPNQTLLIATTRGRSATRHFPETRVINLWNDYREKLDVTKRQFTLLSQTAFKLTLASKDKKVVDEVGNYDGKAAAWTLPMDADARRSLIRRYGTKVEDGGAAAKDGTLLNGWKLASQSALNQAQASTYYGSQDDAGTPGYRAGGALPVSLSSFTATRTDGAIVVEWATASELNNAGFNLLRSSARTGGFTQVNPQLIAGAGTTGERTTYRYTDTSAKPNTMYYYRIEEVSTGGVRQALETTRLKGYLNAEGKSLEPWATLKTEE